MLSRRSATTLQGCIRNWNYTARLAVDTQGDIFAHLRSGGRKVKTIFTQNSKMSVTQQSCANQVAEFIPLQSFRPLPKTFTHDDPRCPPSQRVKGNLTSEHSREKPLIISKYVSKKLNGDYLGELSVVCGGFRGACMRLRSDCRRRQRSSSVGYR